ncbi:MAG: zinc ribbon domain-containing protein [Mariprofundales bacterium]|nr:zinc ribbon domain-containing protein [Mariprofundales bacterium]
MPIYEYRCQQCDQAFETLVRGSSEAVRCPSCGGEQLQRLISAHAVGSGAPDTECGKAPCSPIAACCGGGGGCCR